jgi:hypothetical protein
MGLAQIPQRVTTISRSELAVPASNSRLIGAHLGESTVKALRAFSLRRRTRLAVLAAGVVISFGAAHQARALEPGDLVVVDEFVGLIHVDAQTGQTTPIPTTGLSIHPLAGTELTSGGALDDFVGRVGIGPQGEILFTSTVNLGGGDLDGSIIRVDPSTGAQTAVVSGGLLGSVWDFGFASNGDTFVENSNTVVHIDAATGQQSFFLFVPDLNYGRLTVLPDDDLVVHEYPDTGTPSMLLRVDSVTSGESRTPVLTWVTGVETDEDGVIYYSWCYRAFDYCDEGEVVRITPGGAHETVYSGISPQGFAIAPSSVATVPAVPSWGPALVALLVAATVLALRPPFRSGWTANRARRRSAGR